MMKIKMPLSNGMRVNFVNNNRMRIISSASAIVGTVVSSAIALAQPADQQFEVRCESSADIREILVIAPGTVGKVCDVMYTRNRGQTRSTPYHANSDTAFCYEKAASIRDKLVAANYSCRGAGASWAPQPVVGVAPPAQRTRDIPSQATAAIAASENTPENDVPADDAAITSARDQFLAQLRDERQASATGAGAIGADATGGVEGATQESATPESATSESAIPEEQSARAAVRAQEPTADNGLTTVIAQSIATESQSPEAQVNIPAEKVTTESLIIPDVQTASRAQAGPVALTTNPVTASVSSGPAPVTVQRSSKLVGATPSAYSGDAGTPVSGASEAGAAATVPAPKPATRTVDVVSSILSPAVADQPRSRPDIIKATLAAQAAAWNEGDIEAFMESYWKDKDLTFVSGTEVTKGWDTTLKRYKKRYGTGAALGQLGFDGLDVTMIAENVAIVVGRFNLQRGERFDSGTFTLVMKRFEGAWRIVHDHTVADSL